MRVLIVGGGIAGLALASGLGRAEVDVTVVERGELRGQAGSGLSLFANGMAALDSLELGDDVRQQCGAAPPGIASGLRTPDGRIRAHTHKRIADRLVVVDRTDLCDCLLSRVDSGVVRTSSTVSSVSDETVRLTSGEDITGLDVVVGADGLRSSVRRDAWGALDPGVRQAGYFACRGITKVPVDIEAAGEIWGPAQRFGIAPLPNGRVYWFSVANGRPPAPEDAHQWTRAAFSGWTSDVAATIAATNPSAVQPLPIEELRAPLRTFVRGRTVLVGDAAHAMTPNLGQGANQSLEDVAFLAGELVAASRGQRTVDHALERYDRARRWRAQLMARASGAVGRFAQAEKGPTAWARRGILGA